MVNKKNIISTLKGRVRYFGSVPESFLRVVFDLIYQVTLSAQKAAVRYFIRSHVTPKINLIRLQNQTIVSQLNTVLCRVQTLKHTVSDGFRDRRVRIKVGNKPGILHMRTSHSYFTVAGETRKYFSTLSGESENGSASLSNNTNDKEHGIDLTWFRNDEKLFERAVSVESLKRAWFMLKSNQGMMTVGTSRETLSGINNHWFEATSKKLLDGSFKYPNRRRVLIDKPDGGERPLTIANPRIKVIERALLNAVEPIFEGLHQWEKISKKEYDQRNGSKDKKNFRVIKSKKNIYEAKKTIHPTIFSPHSYGFRPQKSAHQALHVIKHWRTNTSFFIDYDVSKAFDNVNRKRLKNLFNKQVRDVRFWMEISKILNSGVILELKLLFERKGVAQGSIISPFLFNIYLHELDKKIASIQKITYDTQKSYESATYGNIEAEKAYRNISRDFATDNLKRSLKKYGSKEALLEARNTAYKEHHKKYGRRKGIDTDIRHIQYVRYADDFLIGIVGSREYAVQVRKDINNFLKSSLHLKVKKDNLVHRNDGPVIFLGHKIHLSEFQVKTSALPKQIRAARKNKNKSIARFLEVDKRIGRAKSYQLYSKVLSQFSVISEELKISLKSKNSVEHLSFFFAFHNIGQLLMKKLSISDWKQFLEILTFASSPDWYKQESSNPAINRWITYLNDEADRLNEFNAIILRDKLSSLAKLDYSVAMSEGKADSLTEIQLKYLKEAESAAEASLVPEIKKRRDNIIKKFNINMNSPSTLSREEKDLLSLAKELTTLGSTKSSPRRISINAQIGATFAKLRVKGYIHPIKEKAMGNSSLGFHTDSEIVHHFNHLIRGLLNRFSGADNFSKVKGLAQLLRKSCVLTLANKHNKSQNWVYTVYGSEIIVNKDKQGIKEVPLISRSSILNHPNKFNLKSDGSAIDCFELDNMMGKIFKLNHSLEFFQGCSVEGCNETESIEIHHIARLHRKVNSDGSTSVVDRKGRRVKGLPAILTMLNRKQLPLCRKHHLEFEKGIFSNLDTDKLKSVLGKVPTPKNSDFKPVFASDSYSIEK
jgi:retron-type reverse transcriptase